MKERKKAGLLETLESWESALNGAATGGSRDGDVGKVAAPI